MKIIRTAQSDVSVSEETSIKKMWSDEEMEEVNVPYKKIYLADSLGGRAFLTVEEGGIPSIVDIRSYSFDTPYEQQSNMKRRGFFTKVIQKMKELGYSEFVVSIQSNDSRLALGRLIEKGIITPIPGLERGISVDRHPAGFRIN